MKSLHKPFQTLKTFVLAATTLLFSYSNAFANGYPYGNPVITHMYTADASPHVMPDGRVYMITSVDHPNGGGYATMHSYQMFSSADMKNWVDHGEVLHLNDFNEAAGEDWALWAPDMVFRDGTYYIYAPIRIKKADGSVKSYIAVAESKDPTKRFTVTNHKIEGTSGIDPSVFIDDDGTPYLYWGQKKVAKLKSNMRELATSVNTLAIGTDNYMEAPWVHKRNGKYYFSYHTKYNGDVDKNNPDDPSRQKSHLDYCIGDSPMGPFTHKGVMNYELGYNVTNGPKLPGYDFVPWRLCQSNHGGIVEYHGQEYLFYHTSALSSYLKDNFKAKGSWTQRSVCVDKLNYKANGNIRPVQQTIESVAAVSINQPFEIPVKVGNSQVVSGISKSGNNYNFTKSTGVLKVPGVKLGTGYYYFDLKTLNAPAGAKVEIRLGNQTGKLCGTVITYKNSPNINNGISTTLLREAKGTTDVYIIFKLDGDKSKYTFTNLRFFAGAPEASTPPPSETSIKIEAENYTAQSGVGTQTTTDVGGGKNVGWIASGDWMDYSVNVPSSGEYTINFRVASAAQAIKFDLKKGNTVLTSVNASASGGWQTWKTVSKKVNLSKGQQTLRILATGSGWNINWFELVPSESNTDIKIEAENYIAQSGVGTQNTSDVGGGKNVGWIASGDWMDYSVNIPSAGNYTIDFRVASAAQAIKFDLKKGNSVVTSVNAASSGGWQTWKTVSKTVTLTAGQQTLRILATGNGWNINWINIYTPGSKSAINNKTPISSFVSLYPNPARDFLNIETDVNSAEVLIYNLDGKLAQAEILTERISTLDISHLQSGIYILQLRSDAGIESKRLIVE